MIETPENRLRVQSSPDNKNESNLVIGHPGWAMDQFLIAVA